MAANNDIVIEKSDGLQFLFRAVDIFSPDKSQQVVTVPLPNLTGRQAILFRYFGQVETANFSFGIFNDDVDVANGTHTSTVKTIGEQIRYLKDTFFAAGYDVSWSLWDTNDLVYLSSDAPTGAITNTKFDIKSESRSFAQGSLIFRLGNLGNLS